MQAGTGVCLCPESSRLRPGACVPTPGAEEGMLAWGAAFPWELRAQRASGEGPPVGEAMPSWICIQGRQGDSPDRVLALCPARSTLGPGPDSTRTFQVSISGFGCQFRG